MKLSTAAELAQLRAAAERLYREGPQARPGAWDALRAALRIPQGIPPGSTSGSSGPAVRG
jgi:hypothetical protein